MLGTVIPILVAVVAVLAATVVFRARLLYGVLLALGGVALSLIQVSSEIEAIVGEIPGPVRYAVLAAGVLVSFTGIVGLVQFEVVPRIKTRLWLKRVLRAPRYRCRRADGSDLPAVCDLAARVFRTAVSPLESVRQWQAKNPDVIWLIETAKDGPTGTSYDLAGYFCLLPLTRRATELVLAESLTGADVRADDIVKPRGRAASLYVGGIAGLSWRAEGAIIAHLYEAMRRYCAGEIRVLARPVTGEGLELSEKYQLTPLGLTAKAGELNRIYGRMWSPDR